MRTKLLFLLTLLLASLGASPGSAVPPSRVSRPPSSRPVAPSSGAAQRIERARLRGGVHATALRRAPQQPARTSSIQQLRDVAWFEIDRGYRNFDYSSHDNVLLLADGGVSYAQHARRRPGQTVLVTDIEPRPGVNRVVDSMDLSELPADSFSAIVMNRGLCPCHGGTCGGIPMTTAGIRQFLEGTIRVLDKRSPNSIALFTGYAFPGETATNVPRMWREVVEALAAEHPELRITTLHDSNLDSEDGFMGVAIGTAEGPPLHGRIRALMGSDPAGEPGMSATDFESLLRYLLAQQ
jgi:hypothetical protein